jgi:hypothetical protein
MLRVAPCPDGIAHAQAELLRIAFARHPRYERSIVLEGAETKAAM